MTLQISGQERKLASDKLIVSKTNSKGHIVYANDVFLDIADYTLADVLGNPHSMIRHQAMPRCIFQLLWEYLQDGREIFAYVVNSTKSGDYYWVLAHVTPSIDANGNVSSFHSNRRAPSQDAIDKISELYEQLLLKEQSYKSRKEGQKAGYEMLQNILLEKGVSYDEFVLSL